jgi:hypothetical protein
MNDNDTKNAAIIREVLRHQFDGAAETATNPAISDLFAKLSATTTEIPAALIDAYSEFFEDLLDSEREQEMMKSIGVSWWPESATRFVEKFIALSSGSK